jgi:hypothetical protein
MDKKYLQSKLDELDELDEANYIVKADDIDKVGDKLENKLGDDDVVKIVDEDVNPCWKGYKQVGMKNKGGKQVPNCVKESIAESKVVVCPCNGKCKKVAKCKPVDESVKPKMTKNQLVESVLRNSKTVFTVKEFIKENINTSVVLNDQKIDMSSVEIDGVDKSDYPDFVDAYFSYAEYEGGMALTDSELEKLTDEYGELVSELVHSKQLY